MSIEEIHTIIFDFDGVFTDNKVHVDQVGNEMVCCDRRDGLGIDMLRRHMSNHENLDVFILSTETNPVVSARAEKLKLKCTQSQGDKLTFLKSYLQKRFGCYEEYYKGVVYLGNDLNDLSVMKVVGYSVAPQDAHDQIKGVADCVYKQNGGDGFVRAFIENLISNCENLKINKKKVFKGLR